MKKLLAIIRKDTLERFSNRSEWVFFLGLPIFFTMILAAASGRSSNTRVQIVVVDQANSPLSAQLIDALQNSETVRPDLQPLNVAEDQLSQQKVSAVLVIPSEFDLQNVEQGGVQLELRQLPNNLDAQTAERAVQAAIGAISSAVDIANGSISAAEQIKPFASVTDRGTYFETALQTAQTQLGQAPERLKVDSSARSNYDDPRAHASAGQLITWVIIPLLQISGMFAFERQTGTLRRLLVAPTRKATYLLGTILGQVATALVQMLLLIYFGTQVLKVNWGQSPVALVVLLAATALAAAALGTTLGTFVKTQKQANGISVMAGMMLALLGGCWYPLEMFPQILRKAVNILPTTWAMQGMANIILRGQGLSFIWPDVCVLLGFAVVFFTIGVTRFRFE